MRLVLVIVVIDGVSVSVIKVCIEINSGSKRGINIVSINNIVVVSSIISSGLSININDDNINNNIMVI